MSRLRRIFRNLKSFLLLAIGILVFCLPTDTDYFVVCCVMGAFITLKGIKNLIFYISSARHMVGGIKIFVQSLVMIDFGLLSFVVLLVELKLSLYYLVAILFVYGLIGILRTFEQKKYGSKKWIFKLITSLATIAIGVVCLIFASLNSVEIMLLIFSISCLVFAITGFVSSFTKSSIDYVPDLE